MNITATLRYGPIETEIAGEDREEVEQELLAFIEFINENEDELELELPARRQSAESEAVSSQSLEGDNEENPLAPIANELGISLDNLDEVVYVDPDLDENPQLLLDAEEYGEKTVEQQRNAAYVLLYVWMKCYGNDRMESSRLRDILALGSISTANLYRAWRDEGQGKFDSQGKGPGASVALTGVGERTARTVLQDLASEDS